MTLSGIIVSVMAIMSVITLGESLRNYVTKEVESFGTDTIQVEVSVPETGHASAANGSAQAMGVQITTLTDKDAEAIALLPDVAAYNIGLIGQSRTTYGGTKRYTMIWGSSSTAPIVDPNIVVDTGRFFSAEEEKSSMSVVVLGSSVADAFAKGHVADLVGQRITVGNSKYLVVGIAKERGATFGVSLDDMIYMPYTTLQKKILGIDYVSYITIKAADPAHIDRTAHTIRTLLRLRHNIKTEAAEDFAVTTIAEAQDILDTILGGMNILLLALASVSLVVGGIGIMNIMLVSIEERRREIGLRKALGARKNDMIVQFLIESVMIAIAGALVGTVITVLLLSAAFSAVQYAGFDSIHFYIPTKAILVALAFSVSAGVIFGVYPARRATLISPMEALAS